MAGDEGEGRRGRREEEEAEFDEEEEGEAFVAVRYRRSVCWLEKMKEEINLREWIVNICFSKGS